MPYANRGVVKFVIAFVVVLVIVFLIAFVIVFVIVSGIILWDRIHLQSFETRVQAHFKIEGWPVTRRRRLRSLREANLRNKSCVI